MDFEVGNHYTATHPPFVNHLTMTAFTASGRVTITDHELTLWNGDASSTQTIVDRSMLRAQVAGAFRLRPAGTVAAAGSGVPSWD